MIEISVNQQCHNFIPQPMNSAKSKKLITLEFFNDYFTGNSVRKKLNEKHIDCVLTDGKNATENRLAEIELKISLKDLKAAFKILST